MTEQKLKISYKGKQREITARVCDNWFGKLRGFMFSFSKKPILFTFDKEKSVGIHMLFVFQKLLVIWFDENKKIIRIEVMKPFISFKTERAKYVLEIPLRSKIF
jgi:uncharacterized membrane protein (UPF0127 family)